MKKMLCLVLVLVLLASVVVAVEPVCKNKRGKAKIGKKVVYTEECCTNKRFEWRDGQCIRKTTPVTKAATTKTTRTKWFYCQDDKGNYVSTLGRVVHNFKCCTNPDYEWVFGSPGHCEEKEPEPAPIPLGTYMPGYPWWYTGSNPCGVEKFYMDINDDNIIDEFVSISGTMSQCPVKKDRNFKTGYRVNDRSILEHIACSQGQWYTPNGLVVQFDRHSINADEDLLTFCSYAPTGNLKPWNTKYINITGTGQIIEVPDWRDDSTDTQPFPSDYEWVLI